METRKNIELHNSLSDLVMTMAEGNVGCLSVLIEMVKKDELESFAWMLHLDDMNIRGSQVWVGYKDFCDYNLDKFVECIKSRDEDMVDKINEMKQGKWKAVRSGASFGQRPTF